VLGYPRPDGKLILDTDASSHAVGAVLSQEQDGVERVLGYYSQTLKHAERQYCYQEGAPGCCQGNPSIPCLLIWTSFHCTHRPCSPEVASEFPLPRRP